VDNADVEASATTGGGGCRGRGLPASDRERVFAPFQRLDDTSGTGLGLGLAIARGFTEAMHGTLSPSDTNGGGLTMTITLPAAR
jgi:two-component system sensor histidine kinase KdpD